VLFRSGKCDGIGGKIRVCGGCPAGANADAQGGDGHAQRDPLAECDEHGGADADEHAGGGVDALAHSDAETCRDIADTNAHSDATPEIPSLANADATASGESVSDLFAAADADAAAFTAADA